MGIEGVKVLVHQRIEALKDKFIILTPSNCLNSPLDSVDKLSPVCGSVNPILSLP